MIKYLVRKILCMPGLQFISPQKPESLSDIEMRLPKGETTPMDKGIEPLVIALNYFGFGNGFSTYSSCYGHFDENPEASKRHRFPWVQIEVRGSRGEAELAKFKKMVARFNDGSGIKWALEGNGGGMWQLKPFKQAQSAEELEAMQDSSRELAQMVFAEAKRQRNSKLVR